MERLAPPSAQILSDAILERHGDAIAAVLFYGSCLRKRTHEGVHDFYVVVDGYRALYGTGWLAIGNALLPPNVFYLERESPEGTLRAKYAVISTRHFEHCVSPRCAHPYVWARFAQPVLLTFARDPEARDRAVHCVAQAIVTLVQRLAVFLPAKGRVQRFSLAALWQEAFQRTYQAEIRAESPEMVRSLYRTESARYDQAGGEALAVLESGGWLDRVSTRGRAVEVEMDPGRRLRSRWRWWSLRPLAKLLAVLRLLKTAGTFGDWLPYALWKLERHTGVRIEPSEKQRRHPLIFGWPVILTLLLRRRLR